MKSPDKTDWFVQYLDEKFNTLSHLIETNKAEHDSDKDNLTIAIEKVDQKHDLKHRETRYFFVASLATAALLFIKESRDIIIGLLRLLV